MKLPKRLILLVFSLPLLAFPTLAQLPALTDSADGQTLMSDTASTDDSTEVVGYIPTPDVSFPSHQSLRSYVIDTHTLSSDAIRFLGLPRWLETAADFLSDYVFPLTFSNHWWNLRPLFAGEEETTGEWVRLLLLLALGAAALTLLYFEKRRLPALPGEEMAQYRRQEFIRSLRLALYAFAGGLFFAVWSAVGAAIVIIIYATNRHLRKKA